MSTVRRASNSLLEAVGDYPLAHARRLASRFSLPAPLTAYDFLDKGNINLHTYLIVSGSNGSGAEYLLQRINHQVFTLRIQFECRPEARAPNDLIKPGRPPRVHGLPERLIKRANQNQNEYEYGNRERERVRPERFPSAWP